MSKVSLGRRIAALLEAAERIDPQTLAVHNMPPATRQRYELWRAEIGRIVDSFPPDGGWYEAFLEGDPAAQVPEPSRDVRMALNPIKDTQK